MFGGVAGPRQRGHRLDATACVSRTVAAGIWVTFLPKSAGNNRADRDISFTNVRIHNNDSRYQCQDAFRLVQPVRNLRLTDVSVRPTATPFRLATMAIRSAAAVVRVADD